MFSVLSFERYITLTFLTISSLISFYILFNWFLCFHNLAHSDNNCKFLLIYNSYKNRSCTNSCYSHFSLTHAYVFSYFSSLAFSIWLTLYVRPCFFPFTFALSISPKTIVDVVSHLLRNVTFVSQFVKSLEIQWSLWLLGFVKYSGQDY